MRARLVAALLCALLVSACARREPADSTPRAPARPHVALDPTAQPLRAAFNEDAGMVRAVVLVSPT